MARNSPVRLKADLTIQPVSIQANNAASLNLDGYIGIVLTFQLKPGEGSNRGAAVEILFDVLWGGQCPDNTCIVEYSQSIAKVLHDIGPETPRFVEITDYNGNRNTFRACDIAGFHVSVRKDLGIWLTGQQEAVKELTSL